MIELVKEYKYLGINVDNVLSFGSHITRLKKTQLGLYFRNNFVFHLMQERNEFKQYYQFAPSYLLSTLDD